ncbi:pyridoxal-dependent decarboxylase, exosortase A system-associated [Novosphingobium sp. SG720]|uniref:pyridoxal-dependent decarboxylase, exosortase A system-associated n=1 Tax=Novosphingobium sp. SG720 TaxID=2586998 RepID=UPI0014489F1D|nr:pyridoxal-dependent decarboxylase, exosortase A system-associated [Novosphingobium sp. SG720]NKJ41415.1 diaminopimelate decarboxylase [Novosphingobium sp. SG720]
MKPLGPIPPHFHSQGADLLIAGRPARDWAQAHGTPLFVYEAGAVRARVAQLRAALPARVRLHYAVKANPFGPLLALLAELVDGFDIASAGELALLKARGIDPARAGFAGPGKRDAEIAAALAAGVTLHCESAREVERALALGAAAGHRPKLAIRVNPDFDLRGSGMKMGGGARPFGVDAENVPPLARRIVASGADWRGLHIYAGSQALDAQAVIATQAATLDLAARLAGEAGVPLPALNLGGGFGIPYFPGDTPLDLAAVGSALAARLADLPPVLHDTQLTVELGRYLVGEAGVYLAQVVERKESRGEVFLVTDGGLHHQLAASGNFGTVVRRNYPLAIATRMDVPATEIASVVGCLCTPLDRLADKAALPRGQEGDLVAVFCAGAYGATASPAAFLGHGPASEILAETPVDRAG